MNEFIRWFLPSLMGTVLIIGICWLIIWIVINWYQGVNKNLVRVGKWFTLIVVVIFLIVTVYLATTNLTRTSLNRSQIDSQQQQYEQGVLNK